MNTDPGVGATAASPPVSLLVTGATGFIGSAVVRELLAHRAGPRIRVLARRPIPQWMVSAGVTRVEGDLARPATVRGVCAAGETVLHLAAQVGGDPDQCVAVNEGGTRALLADARRTATSRVVYLSTCGVYGGGTHQGQAEPELVPAPLSVTSRTRLSAERLVLAAGGMVLRPHLVYGEGDRHVVPTVARWLRRVPAWADGGQARMSLIAVTDLAAAVVALARAPWHGRAGEVFHVNHPEPVLARDLLTRVCGLLGASPPERDLPVGVHRRLTRAAMPELTEHQFSLLAEDHWYDSRKIWRFTGLSPGPGFARRWSDAADWYRAESGGW